MSSVPTSPGDASSSAAPVKEGDVLASKYRVEKVLGVGGMGVVVAAEHIELSQKVALKFLLKQAAANEDLVGRFLREARASVRLKGAHVAKTLDVGRLEDGAPYIVMEFLEGHDLHSEIRSKTEPMPIDVACSYIIQASEGLAEAHSLGIVHRDLKPGNLFLTRGVDGKPLVKVLDFGISKTMDTSIGGDGLSLTKTEMLLGSPLYMSPEQMRSSKHVDERSDLWAIGAIAYELLTRKVPFEAETILELCFKVAQEKAPNPNLHRPDLPDALCAAVLRCLEKDPAERFANVGELMAAFEPFALPRDRGSAERALDVLGTGKRPPMRSLPAASIGNAVTVGLPNVVGSGSGSGAIAAAATPMPAGTPPPPSSSSVSAEPPAQAAWGTTQAQDKAAAKRRGKGMIAVAAGVVLVAGFAVMMVTRHGASDMPAAGVVASAGPLPAPPAAPSAPIAEPSAPTTGTPSTPSNAVAPVPQASIDSGAPSVVVAPPVGVVTGGRGGKPAGSAGKLGVKAATSAPPSPGGAPSATAPAPPQAEQGGFIKVRE